GVLLVFSVSYRFFVPRKGIESTLDEKHGDGEGPGIRISTDYASVQLGSLRGDSLGSCARPRHVDRQQQTRSQKQCRQMVRRARQVDAVARGHGNREELQ